MSIIKVQDIRIGSLFHFETRKQLRLACVGTIYRDRLIIHILPNYSSARTSINKLIPIELTDAEMENMGFVLYSDGGELSGNDRFWKHPLLEGSISYGTYRFQYQKNLKFKHVHEIQAFMNVMTKKEVIYKYRIPK